MASSRANPHPIRRSSPGRGVSLVEALVAMAVMSIGMLSLVGVQSAMRLNSDLAKQRTEATRIASEELETLRSFQSVPVVDGAPGISYDEIDSRTVEAYTPPNDIGNTSYRIERTVRTSNVMAYKLVTVTVRWTDRSNLNQSVTLDSAISGVAPSLTAMLMVPHRDTALQRNRGLHSSIPEGAVPFSGDPTNTSQFTPPGSSGITWYFNNLTGLMRVCTGTVTDITTCPQATLVTGTVRFQTTATQPTGADAELPQSDALPLAAGPSALTLADAVGSGTATSCFSTMTGRVVRYFCAVSTSDTAGWGGQLNLVLASGSFSNLDSGYKSCRYTRDLPTLTDSNPDDTVNELDLNAEFTANADHPRKYCLERPRNSNEAGSACTGRRVKVNLINQDFLVIRGNNSCPTELNNDGTANGQGQNDLILANTRQHQPNP